MTDSNATFMDLNLGTSCVRALLVDSEGSSIDSTEFAYLTECPKEGSSEQSPCLLIKARKAVLVRLSTQFPKQLQKPSFQIRHTNQNSTQRMINTERSTMHSGGTHHDN